MVDLHRKRKTRRADTTDVPIEITCKRETHRAYYMSKNSWPATRHGAEDVKIVSESGPGHASSESGGANGEAVMTRRSSDARSRPAGVAHGARRRRRDLKGHHILCRHFAVLR